MGPNDKEREAIESLVDAYHKATKDILLPLLRDKSVDGLACMLTALTAYIVTTASELLGDKAYVMADGLAKGIRSGTEAALADKQEPQKFTVN